MTNGFGFDSFIEEMELPLLDEFLELDMSELVEFMVRTVVLEVGRSKTREFGGRTGSTETVGDEDEDTGLDWITAGGVALREVDEALEVRVLRFEEKFGSCRSSTFFESLNILRSSS